MIAACRSRKAIALTALLFATAVLCCTSGCSAKTEDDSTIPWSRPASWEGGLPGMTPGTGSGY